MLLLICLGLILGIGNHLTKWAFVLVAVWWVSWAQPAFRRLPTRTLEHRPSGNLLAQGFKELRIVAGELKGQQHLTRYLTSFFIMSMAVQTIMLMATSFGIKEVQLTSSELIVATLLVQFVAIPGAFLVAWLSGQIGNVKTLGCCILAWCAVCVFAYFFATTKATTSRAPTSSRCLSPRKVTASTPAAFRQTTSSRCCGEHAENGCWAVVCLSSSLWLLEHQQHIVLQKQL